MPIRFDPPRLTLTPELRWMLLRAFGPVGAPFAEPFEPAAALALARRFEASARIAARHGRLALAGELGAEAAAGFARDRVAATAVGLRLLGMTRHLAELAEPLGLPLVFLKFVALEAAGLEVVGSRGACDVDVLVPAARAAELEAALLAAGCRSSGMPEAEHQLPALQHPSGGSLEVHLLMLGVRPEGKDSARFEALERQGLLQPLAELPGRCSVPAPEAQAAHVLVHGLGQHGYWPASYSLLKMVADLIDLSGPGGSGLTARAFSWVERDVSVEEADAVRKLCALLARGVDPAAWEGGPEELLLRHILAGRLDPAYAEALRLGLFRPQPSDRPPGFQLLYRIRGALFLSKAQIDAIYGRPSHPLGYLGRRLARPFDLLVRLGRYGARSRRLGR